MIRQWLSLFLASLTLMLSGCGDGQELGSVEGIVKMDGKPLPRATVVFVPSAGGRPGASQTDKDGKYVLNFSGGRKGSIPGKNSVRISTLADAFLDAQGNNLGSPETVPVEFNRQTTLEFDVVANKRNIANFELKSGGKVINEKATN